MRQHNWNSYSQTSVQIGRVIPVLCQPVLKRQYGAMVSNALALGERVAAGTPFEFDLATRSAKFLKSWLIKAVSAGDGTTTVTLAKTAISPKLNNNTMLMVMPSSLSGTGKAALCGGVVEGENTYTVTLTTASFDALAVGGYLVESSATEAGSAKSVYCVPNNISTEDVIKGSENTLVDVPRGHIYMYQNTIPAMPEVVKSALFNNDIQVSWELFNEDAN